ncbi:MAG: sodium:solute symporter family protein [Gemmatimonadetes bacterium]|nr:sodium:solute symporter family protein [Gemmatimonadota bacterium]MYA64023.1 sodium:solute symporter family protein [Gemmatimonadota bacterium]MYB98843.1 sodium:solute symporter family protein [Gemmatimonadota bacterium]MYH54119.1 sodium:solute symporter family protein [Gemmatimonadota bacterium]MYI46495.1 sodium:solute symporter family protein [Gemmatimonadota bacterium]
MEPWVVSTSLIFIYLIATIVIGVLANRKGTSSMEDFFLYGRQAGIIVLYLTVVATFHSAFAFLGSGGFFFTHGIGFWMAGTWTVLVGAITYTLGTRIWALGKKFGYITPADLIADFFESETVRIIVALVSVIFTLIYIQVQAQGLGYILSVATGDRISFELAALILLVVAAAYLMVGGLRAVYWTDVIQGIWMYVAVWAGSLLLTYKLFGGPVELWRRLMAERPDLLSLPGPEGFFTPGMWVGMTIALSFGIIFQPHMMIRYFTAASGRTLKILGATTPIYLMTLFIPAAFVGLGGALILPDLASPDRVFPELLFQYAPPWLTGLILAGATAAAMSTLDSILHSNMTVLTRDVYQRYIAKGRSQGHYLAFGRCVVVALLGVGFYLTVRTPDYLVALVTLSGAGALQLMPAVLGVCYPGRRLHTAAGVVAGISAGLVTLFLTRIQFPQPLGIHEALWSLGVNFAVTIIVSRFTRPPSAATVERIHGEVERFVYDS